MKLYVLYMFVVAASAASAVTDSESEAADRWSRLNHPSISTTNTQQQSLRKLLQLSDGADETNLGICEGDCDRDSDCRDAGAVCYQRYQTESVPGCEGVGVNKRDYCAFRPPNYLFWVSNGGSGYGLCEGDCDSDVDCDQSGPPLKCFQRTGTTPVPGCDGVGRRSTDYCILDGTSQPTGNPTNVPTSSPSQEPTSLPTEIPTSSPTGVPTNTPSQFPTSQPTSPPTDNPTKFGSTNTPTNLPTKAPTGIPSTAPTSNPTSQPTNAPTSNPTSQPTGVPTSNPTSVPTSAPSPTEATTCILVTTGNGQYDDGFLDLTVNSGTGSVKVTKTSKYGQGSQVLNQCYTNFIGVQVTNPNSNAWAGFIGFSLDNGVSYSAMSCQDCTGTTDTTEYIVVDGNTDGTGDPKCLGGISGNICTLIIPPPPQPTSPPTPSPTPTLGPDAFIPGELTKDCDNGNLLLSAGMACERIASEGSPVSFVDGTSSAGKAGDFHQRADGAGIIPSTDPSNPGGYYYVTNSERGSGNGGAGAIVFDANGQVINYMGTRIASSPNLLTDTSRNCGGGLTWWGTWVSCEENGLLGQCYEVDPNTGYTAAVKNTDRLGDYESFAYDKDDPVAPRFFTTEDDPFGALIRYTPSQAAYSDCWPEELPACNQEAKYGILSSVNGTYDYLVLDPSSGTFEWTPDRSIAESNARSEYPNSEGITVRSGILNFVSKTRTRLYTLDLATGFWESFDLTNSFFSINQPDQMAMMFGNAEYLFFCEDSLALQRSDIFGRYIGQGPDSGKFFTLVQATPTSTLGDRENTGLAFSPENKFMFVTYQLAGVYKFWRTDGQPFSATFADVKYHTN